MHHTQVDPEAAHLALERVAHLALERVALLGLEHAALLEVVCVFVAHLDLGGGSQYCSLDLGAGSQYCSTVPRPLHLK